MLIIGTDIFSHPQQNAWPTLLFLLFSSFISAAALYLQHTQHLGTKTTPDTQFSQVKAIHKTPNKLIRLSTNLTLFETGIKVVDLLTPYVQGGKIDLFGGAGLGKTVVIMELIIENTWCKNEGKPCLTNNG